MNYNQLISFHSHSSHKKLNAKELHIENYTCVTWKLNYQLYGNMFIVIEIFTCTHNISTTFIHAIVQIRDKVKQANQQNKLMIPYIPDNTKYIQHPKTITHDPQYITYINVCYYLSNPWIVGYNTQNRDVKRRSIFQTSNYMFEFEFGIATFNIHFHLAVTYEVVRHWHVITQRLHSSQEQEVKFQDPIFRKFQDIFVGFMRLKTQKMHVFLSWYMRGLGQSPSRNRIWCILALKDATWWQQIWRLRSISGHSDQMSKISAQLLISGHLWHFRNFRTTRSPAIAGHCSHLSFEPVACQTTCVCNWRLPSPSQAAPQLARSGFLRPRLITLSLVHTGDSPFPETIVAENGDYCPKWRLVTVRWLHYSCREWQL